MWWKYKIILSALERIAFTEPPHPKIPHNVSKSLKDLWIELDRFSNDNPFVSTKLQTDLDSTAGARSSDTISSLQSAPLGESTKFSKNSYVSGNSLRLKVNDKPHFLSSLLALEEIQNTSEGCPNFLLQKLFSIHIREMATKLVSVWEDYLLENFPSYKKEKISMTDPANVIQIEKNLCCALKYILEALKRLEYAEKTHKDEIETSQDNLIAECDAYERELENV